LGIWTMDRLGRSRLRDLIQFRSSLSAVVTLLFDDKPARLTPNGDHELRHAPDGQPLPYIAFAPSPAGGEHNLFGVALILMHGLR
jgi:hypothetical protein